MALSYLWTIPYMWIILYTRILSYTWTKPYTSSTNHLLHYIHEQCVSQVWSIGSDTNCLALIPLIVLWYWLLLSNTTCAIKASFVVVWYYFCANAELIHTKYSQKKKKRNKNFTWFDNKNTSTETKEDNYFTNN